MSDATSKRDERTIEHLTEWYAELNEAIDRAAVREAYAWSHAKSTQDEVRRLESQRRSVSEIINAIEEGL